MAYQFINPYNFIPLSKKEPDKEEKEKGSTYSGVIEYSVMTKTPLVIPNTSTDNAFQSTVPDHKTYDFFSYNDLSEMKESVEKQVFTPVIPGSEMRGMIRSNFEILTNSCLSSLDSDSIIGKRTHEIFAAGLLEKRGNDYYLYEADDCILTLTSLEDGLKIADPYKYNRNVMSYQTTELREGQKVKIDVEEIDKKTRSGRTIKTKVVKQIGAGKETGYVIKGEEGPTKHNCHVFVCKNANSPIDKNISIDLLDTVLEAYSQNKKAEYKEYRSKLKEFCKGLGNRYFPVYYNKVKMADGNQLTFLAPASITREAYENTISNLVGKYRTCKDKGKLCPACTLFGTVITGKNAAAVASRIRFTDMVFNGEKEDSFLNPITLAPLSSPKINNMEFYLERPAKDAVFWTYDYYIDKNGKLYANKAGINGRKFYWHNMNYQSKSVEATNLNVTVRPLKENRKFTGKVYFEQISKEELDQLIFTLNCGDWSNVETTDVKTHGYKLGGAKPLGFGSIAISVDNVILRQVVLSESDKCVKRVEIGYKDYSAPEFDRAILDNFEKMTDFKILGNKNVDYPRTETDGDIRGWFGENHKALKSGTTQLTNSPNKRVQEFFDSYMKPMEPELVSTGVQYSGSTSDRSRSQQSNYSSTTQKKNKFEIGDTREGIVEGHNPSGFYAKAKLKDGGKISFKDTKNLKDSTEVVVKYMGVGDNGFEKWELVRVK